MEIAEIFYSIQGEGPNSGRPCTFIRLWGCNLSCPGCDTELPRHPTQLSPEAILSRVPKNSLRVVVTGGEPCIQPQLGHLVSILAHKGHLVSLETNGTTPLHPDTIINFESISVSPKKQAPPDLAGWNFERVNLKIVVGDGSWCWSPEEVREYLTRHADWVSRTWLMPEGAARGRLDDSGPVAWGLALELGANYSDRLHIRCGGK